MAGSQTADLRFDSIAQLWVPNHVLTETHVVGPIAGQPGRYGVRLNEIPLKGSDPAGVANSSGGLDPFVIPDPSIIVAGYSLVSTDPAATEFRPDWFIDSGQMPYRTSIVYFHSSKNGTSLDFEYYGGGALISAEDIPYIPALKLVEMTASGEVEVGVFTDSSANTLIYWRVNGGSWQPFA